MIWRDMMWYADIIWCDMMWDCMMWDCMMLDCMMLDCMMWDVVWCDLMEYMIWCDVMYDVIWCDIWYDTMWKPVLFFWIDANLISWLFFMQLAYGSREWPWHDLSVSQGAFCSVKRTKRRQRSAASNVNMELSVLSWGYPLPSSICSDFPRNKPSSSIQKKRGTPMTKRNPRYLLLKFSSRPFVSKGTGSTRMLQGLAHYVPSGYLT
jgi:hypothetical protein